MQLGWRYYAPEVCRFASRDALTYCGNLRSVDRGTLVGPFVLWSATERIITDETKLKNTGMLDTTAEARPGHTTSP